MSSLPSLESIRNAVYTVHEMRECKNFHGKVQVFSILKRTHKSKRAFCYMALSEITLSICLNGKHAENYDCHPELNLVIKYLMTKAAQILTTSKTKKFLFGVKMHSVGMFRELNEKNQNNERKRVEELKFELKSW